jgi:hypothetical protein
MKSLLYFIKPISFLLLITATTFCQHGQSTEKCGSPSNGIALCLSPLAEHDGVILEIKNTGPEDAVLNLGIMLANGARQYPRAVTLLLIDSEGKQHHAELAEPTLIAGRVDPFIVPLPKGASLKLPLYFFKYFNFAANHVMEEFKLDPVKHYTVQAQFTGIAISQATANLDIKGIALMPFWTGTVSSNNIEIGAK